MSDKNKLELVNNFRGKQPAQSKQPKKDEIPPMVSLCDMPIGWTVNINGIPFTIKQQMGRRRVMLIEYKKPAPPKEIN